jgi:hypothetical protein
LSPGRIFAGVDQMSFEVYLEIVRSMFLPSFGPVAESVVQEFFDAGVEAVAAAFLIGDGLTAFDFL